MSAEISVTLYDMVKGLALIFAMGVAAMPAAALKITGTGAEPVQIAPPANTGLEALYVVQHLGPGAVLQWPAGDGQPRFSRFSTLGGAYAEEVQASLDSSAGVWNMPLSDSDMGYIVEENGRSHYYWVVDYSAHAFAPSGFAVAAADGDCNRVLLNVAGGNAAPISYYTINGRHMELSRELQLSYNTLQFDNEAFAYHQTAVTTTLDGITGSTTVEAPLCNTILTLEGDRFLKAWGDEATVESGFYTTPAIDANTRAENVNAAPDNMQPAGNDGLGGSAPCTITFEAAVTDAVVFMEWQISRSSEFDILENSYNEPSFTYTFTEAGNMYVRFTANNNAGDCEYTGETYTVFVGDSKLDIPNAFSPGASPGVNDEWKVSYRSLVSYECHIFNRWGKQLFSSTDPAEGWDGKVRGKVVPAGVYYYVIKAKGSDGIRYDRAGDINIINYTGSSQNGPTDDSNANE